MKNKKIVILGSCNTDLVIKVRHFPLPGETIIGSDFMTNQGGKGANQAVSVARMGGNALFIAKVGNDSFGKNSIEALNAEGIDTRYCYMTNDAPTGVAMIDVDEQGENTIIVASGANALLSPGDVENAREEIENAEILLMQLETPLPTLMYAAEIAHKAGVTVVLNPAPFPNNPLPEDFLKNIDIITPNETEAEYMSGIHATDTDSALKAIAKIKELGVSKVVITAGAAGAYMEENGKAICVPTRKTKVIDTTAAGDTFCGALCVSLSEEKNLEESISFANKAASITVTRMGAWQSIPHRDVLD